MPSVWCRYNILKGSTAEEAQGDSSNCSVSFDVGERQGPVDAGRV